MFYFFFKGTATTEIYAYLHTLSRHDALPIWAAAPAAALSASDWRLPAEATPATTAQPVAAPMPTVAQGRRPAVPAATPPVATAMPARTPRTAAPPDRKSTRLNSSH